MAFKMGMTKEDLSGPKVAPNNIYELQTTGFRPKVTKAGDALCYNVELTIVNHGPEDGKKVFHPLPTSWGQSIRDYCHAMGVPLEKKVIDGVELDCLPGMFENQDQYPDDPSKWGKYMGPLTNKIGKAEVVGTSYQGKPKNEVRAFICAIPGCATIEPELRHSTNLIKNN
jgi:hypothetical protein